MENLNKQFSEKITQSTIDSHPFDHIYIENFFEKNLYDNILSNIPDINSFKNITETGNVGKNYSQERYVLSLKKDLHNLPESQQSFWNNFNNAFSSKEFWEAISLKFKETLKKRFSSLTKKELETLGKSPKISCGTLLVKDFTKYRLGAHTDAIEKIFSLLFYLPKNNDLKKIGTSLYKPFNQIEEERIDIHFDKYETEKRFEKIKTCEYKRNSVFIFARTNYSYHGVEEVNIDKLERDLLLVNFYGNKS